MCIYNYSIYQFNLLCSVISSIFVFIFIMYIIISYYFYFSDQSKMSFLFHPLKITELLSFAWAGIKLLTEDFYRYIHREEIIVRIKSGQVKGFKIATNYNYHYYNFLGIPYAKPPIGELRFKVCVDFV